jgi:cytochrome c oxidase subunit 2
MITNFNSFVLGLSKPAQLGFQPAYSPIMEGIIDLHNYICFFLVAILIFVCWMLFYTVYEYKYTAYTPSEEELFKKFSKRNPSFYKIGQALQFIFKHYRKLVVDAKNLLSTFVGRVDYKHTRNLTHWTNLEIIWTILPSFILLAIAIPSFILLYSMDELTDDIAVTIKIVGHQWYWNYQYTNPTFLNFIEKNNPNNFNFDSYMIPTVITDTARNGEVLSMRLLTVDNPLWLPVKTHIRLMITSADVIHSWAVPALGVKVDAVPGRINQAFLYINEPGRYFGQCSEICGANHGFMPIEIIAMPWKEWSSFYKHGFINTQI